MRCAQVRHILQFLKLAREDVLVFMCVGDEPVQKVDCVDYFEEQFDTILSVVLQCKKVEQLTAKMLKNQLSSHEHESKLYITDLEGFMVDAISIELDEDNNILIRG